jgi:hypothetical protein
MYSNAPHPASEKILTLIARRSAKARGDPARPAANYLGGV